MLLKVDREIGTRFAQDLALTKSDQTVTSGLLSDPLQASVKMTYLFLKAYSPLHTQSIRKVPRYSANAEILICIPQSCNHVLIRVVKLLLCAYYYYYYFIYLNSLLLLLLLLRHIFKQPTTITITITRKIKTAYYHYYYYYFPDYYYLYINSGKSGSLFFVFSGKLPDGFLSNFAILFSVLFSGL